MVADIETVFMFLYFAMLPLGVAGVVYGLWVLNEHAKWEQRAAEIFRDRYGNSR